MIKTKSTNNVLRETLLKLEKQGKKENATVWTSVGEILAKNRKNRAVVNLDKIEKYSNEGDTVVIPGKVLGTGKLTKKVTVIAFEFSNGAKEKINEKGTAMDIETGINKNPKGAGLKILK